MRNEKGQFVKGHSFTQEMLKKMSDAKSGKPSPTKGKKLSEETIAKMKVSLKGRSAWNKGIHTNTNKDLRTGEETACLNCGKMFYIQRYLLKSGRKKFCSKACFFAGRELKHTFQSGENHPAYVNGMSLNKYTSEFKPSLKRRIRERDGFICQLCGITETEHKERYKRVLVVNHIDFDKKNCSEDNLNTLCIGCNSRINWNREHYTNYFKKQFINHGA